MKILFILILTIIFANSFAQDIHGNESQKMELIYLAKYTVPAADTCLLSDSTRHYSGSQGGTAIYNPYQIKQTDIKCDFFPGTYRVEFGYGQTGQELGWIPWFINTSDGFLAIVQSNSPDCDCNAYAIKISQQIDVHTRTINPSISGGETGAGGCTFTLWLYWIYSN